MQKIVALMCMLLAPSIASADPVSVFTFAASVALQQAGYVLTALALNVGASAVGRAVIRARRAP